MKRIRIPGHPPLIPVILFLIAGIVAADTFGFFRGSLLLLVLFSFLIAIVGMSRFRWAVIGLGSLACIWGFYATFRIEYQTLPPEHVIHYCDGSLYQIQGRISSFQEEYLKKIRIRLEVEALIPAKGPGISLGTTGSILLNIYDHRNFTAGYGDRISFEARLKPVRNFHNPGAFDYQTYLRRKGIYGLSHVNGDQIRVTSCTVWPVKIVQAIENLRNRYSHFIKDTLADKDSADILSAIITGKKRLIQTRIRDDFSRAGISHLLAISGLHMSIVGLVFFWLFFYILTLSRFLLLSGLAKKISLVLTLVILLVYAIFSGFSHSTQRAFVMTFVFMVSFMFEKEQDPLNTLALAAVLILIIDPLSLFSVSLQLSFVAVLFILMGFELVRHKGWLKGRGTRILAAGLVPVMAGLGTAPLVALYFNTISHIQVLANLLMIPVLGFVCLPLGFAAFALFTWWPGIAVLIIRACGWLIDFCLMSTQFLTSLPYMWSRTVTPDFYDIVLIYLFFGALFWMVWTPRKKKALILLACILTAACVHTGMVWQKRFQPGQTSVIVMDVGQGSACLIRTPDGGTVLVDGGGFPQMSSFDLGRYVVGPFLWRENIKTLDLVILTHPEADHMNGLIFILENFRVKRLIKNKETRTSPAYERLMEICTGKDIPVTVQGSGPAQMILDSARFRFFPCNSLILDGNSNDNSLVFQLEYGLFSMLFTGDIMHGREVTLAESMGSAMKSTLLLAPHHGSSSSSSDFFLDLVNPESVIVSCGFNNRYNFPHPAVLERYRAKGYNIFRTDLNGAVTVVTNGKHYEILTQIKDRPCFSSTSLTF